MTAVSKDHGGIASEDPSAGTAPLTHRQILLVFSGLILGMLLAALDQMIVSQALPTIVGQLGGLDKLSWVVTGYLLTSTAVVPLYGKVSDLYGRKIVFQAAIVIFLVGSVLCGASQNMLQLIVFRGLQGVGGGGLMAMAMAIIGDIVSPRQRGRYTGYMGSVFALASVGGPLIGGFFVDNLSWRWIFYINLPVGFVALFVTSIVLRLPFRRVPHRVDIEGALLLVGSVTSVQLALLWGGSRYPWSSPQIMALAMAGLLLCSVFIVQEVRASEPILPLRLFRNSVFTVSSGIGFFIGCGMFGGMIFLPLFLQVVTGASATNSGLLMLPMMAGMMSTSIVVGRVVTATGRYKIFPVAGSAIATLGMWLLAGMDAQTTRLQSSLYMIILGAGMGMVMQLLVLVVQNAADFRDLGVVTSASNFFRQIGGTFGAAAFGAIFATRFRTELARVFPALPGARPGGFDMSRMTNSPAAIRALPPGIREAIVDALARSIRTTFLAAVPVMAGSFVLAWFLKELPLRDTVNVGMSREQEVPVPAS